MVKRARLDSGYRLERVDTDAGEVFWAEHGIRVAIGPNLGMTAMTALSYFHKLYGIPVAERETLRIDPDTHFADLTVRGSAFTLLGAKAIRKYAAESDPDLTLLPANQKLERSLASLESLGRKALEALEAVYPNEADVLGIELATLGEAFDAELELFITERFMRVESSDFLWRRPVIDQVV